MSDLAIEYVPLADLLPYARNSRTHSDEQVAEIAASIREFGFTNPCLITGENDIIAGHGRVRAAAKAGLDHVPCIRLGHLTETQRKAYVIADNRLALNAGWDSAMLTLELQDLQAQAFDLDLLGFEEAELAALLSPEAAPAEGLTDPDAVQDDAPTRCKPGDLWVLGGHRLLCGDSTNVQHVERLMGSEKADICFTSPPYNAGKGGWLRHGKDLNLPNNQKYLSGGDDRTDDDYSTLLNDFTALALTWCRYVFVNLQMLKHNRLPLIDYQHRHRDQLKDIFIWNKANCAPNIVKGAFNTKFEFVYCFSKDDAATRAFPVEWQGKYYNVVETRHNGNNEFATVHQAGFPAEFPVWFLERLDFAKIVYEPFCGTGTTMVACEQHHRRCFGVELEPKYCDVILARWEAFTGKVAVLQPAEGGDVP